MFGFTRNISAGAWLSIATYLISAVNGLVLPEVSETGSSLGNQNEIQRRSPWLNVPQTLGKKFKTSNQLDSEASNTNTEADRVQNHEQAEKNEKYLKEHAGEYLQKAVNLFQSLDTQENRDFFSNLGKMLQKNQIL